MVSFDVVSLFTRVPIAEALKVIKQRLKKDETLMDRTSISVERHMCTDQTLPQINLLSMPRPVLWTNRRCCHGLPRHPSYLTSIWNTLRRRPWALPHWNPRSGRGTWMTPLSSGPTVRKPWKPFLTSSTTSTSHTVHHGGGSGQTDSLPWHIGEKRREQVDHFSVLQEDPHRSRPSNSHGLTVRPPVWDTFPRSPNFTFNCHGELTPVPG